MAGRQELSPAVGPFDHQMGFALVPLVAHHQDHLPRQGMVRRRDLHPLDVTGTRLLSLAVSV
jgi:hypothetical protein